MSTYLSADEAADELGVTKNTLYAYVSRGLIRSEPGDSSRRTRRYRAEDVQRLKRKKKLKQDPTTAARTALDWGLPVTESRLTLIDDGRFYYRGQDACHLAQSHDLEEVAPLVWDTGRDRIRVAGSVPSVDPDQNSDVDSTLDRMQTLLPNAAATDEQAYDFSRRGVARTGTRILPLLLSLVHPEWTAKAGQTVAERLGAAWGIDREDRRRLLNTALVLCVDHGLNVTAFTVRCVASAGSTPYAAVNAGLSALRGRRHTGNTARISALLREAEDPQNFRDTVASRLRRGDTVPGFGHPLYPDGDPRAKLLIDQLRTVAPDTVGTGFAETATTVGPELLDRPPALDFALVALGRALELPREAPLILFALGRTVGWTGHMIEQYEEGEVIRPRAKYVGPAPNEA